MTASVFFTCVIGLLVTGYVLIKLIFAQPRKTYECPCRVDAYISRIRKDNPCDCSRCAPSGRDMFAAKGEPNGRDVFSEEEAIARWANEEINRD